MSGFNPKTGTFELTASRARFWLRRTEYPPELKALEGMEFIAGLLRHAGHEVVKVRNGWLTVKATQGQVWEALSGQPSDPEREARYYGNPGD